MLAQANRESDILALWERGVGLDRWRREDALLAADDAPRQPPRQLGARNAALLNLRNAHFAGPWALVCACPDCGAEVEFSVDCIELAANLVPAGGEGPTPIDWRGRSVEARAAVLDDLRAVAGAEDIGRALLARCMTGVDVADCTDAEIEELGARLEALDPAAVVEFDMICPDCAATWPALIDLADALWRELRGAAERLLLDVDALARAYGWTEAQVLDLTPARRAAYLQLAESQ